jgi:hydrogenase maturation protease
MRFPSRTRAECAAAPIGVAREFAERGATPRVLVAGIGNIFLGDDGFGVEVVRRLAEQPLPDWVQVADYGISGLHLAYDLLGGYHTTILVDAASRGGEPGTVYVIELAGPADVFSPAEAVTGSADVFSPAEAVTGSAEVFSPAEAVTGPAEVFSPAEASARDSVAAVGGTPVRARPVDGHGMRPDAVLELLAVLGGDAGRVLVVGCEPADVDQGIGLSAPVAGAVDEAVRLVRELIHTSTPAADAGAAAR